MTSLNIGERRVTRLGHYDYSTSENPLSDEEKQRRHWQRLGLITEFLERKSSESDDIQHITPEQAAKQYSGAFSLLMGPDKVDATSSSPADLRRYSTKLESSLKWVDALYKQLGKEKKYVDELCELMEQRSEVTGDGGGAAGR